ncbi:glycoside hydrolase family 15 protein [Stakelama saccharophila]|uniref:Glycoside hydrolase family 15 protein n=1 Tax=Stakelama saccharophila TaxID=3075605 RepID=A0ABZ0BCN7_9SPHN|nr:glycoside hydrolase family 15 protein [Stakelama sp. W311]WNO54054.1 glycoside hydrolase family 15 protein [Stakelama sp. W311]
MARRRIEDYGLIGDGETAALVGRDGSIDWLCLPRFDSGACFAALLGTEDNGCWRLRPDAAVRRTERRYIDHTLILETVFETDEGTVAVTDFMPIRGEAPDIVRIVEGRSGCTRMRSDLALRFDYGRIHPLVQSLSDVRAVAISGPDAVALDFAAEIAFVDRWARSEFTVAAGDTKAFILTWFASHHDVPERVDPARALADTHRYWKDWLDRSRYDGPYREAVLRSLITLKALIHRPTGGITAAPTSSLPECSGGKRNWDYRYCWLRDATFTLLSFVQAGMTREASHWIEWLRRTAGGEPIDLQPFYTVGGDRRAPEWEADWLPGFNGARPVRFGNAAAGQCQLDIYGETVDALYRAAEHGLGKTEDSSTLVRLLADKLETVWEEPDAGIWESRGDPACYTYSKVMCWVAFDRAARWFDGDDPERSRRCRELADHIHALVCDRGYDEDVGSFTQTFDGTALDASALRIPLVGFLPADDPRIRSTVAAVERNLMRGGYVVRYSADAADDGIGGGEGAFIAASYWLADVYALQGRMDEARALFERLLARANDLMLLSEELDTDEARLLGNFPQGLSHLSLITTAMNLGGGGPAHRRSSNGDRSR